MLEIYNNVFVNEGGGSRHDPYFKGFSLLSEFNRGEIMQMDAAMGAVAAIQDMFVQSRRNILYVGAGIPARWENSGVRGMPAPGGFRVSCDFNRGKCTFLEITATRDNELKLQLPIPDGEWQLPEQVVFYAENKVTAVLKKGTTLSFPIVSALCLK